MDNLDFYFAEPSRISQEFDSLSEPNTWDTSYAWIKPFKGSYPYHNQRSYTYNMKILYHFHRYGWDDLVKRYHENEEPFI